MHRKRIGFLSFGHWHPHRTSETRTGADALLQSIELAVAAEEIGLDGAFFRVHHFVRQLSSPFPLLAAVAARTSRIELGTGVVDLRYENPLYMAEEAAVTDLISGGRLQLGISRGAPEPAVDGAEAFGFPFAPGETDTDVSRRKAERFRAAIAGVPMAHSDRRMSPEGALAIQPQSPGLPDRIWWGSGTRATAAWTAEQGMNLMSSTLLIEDTGVPLDQLQAEQIRVFREAWRAAGWERTPRVSVSRSVTPITTAYERQLFGGREDAEDQVADFHGGRTRFGRTYTGAPDVIAAELAQDAAVAAADTLLLTVPNQLGVEHNVRMLETIAPEIAPALGWSPAGEDAALSA